MLEGAHSRPCRSARDLREMGSAPQHGAPRSLLASPFIQARCLPVIEDTVHDRHIEGAMVDPRPLFKDAKRIGNIDYVVKLLDIGKPGAVDIIMDGDKRLISDEGVGSEGA